MQKRIGACRAHTNIALIKYWGKRDQTLFLPTSSSLSLTLNAFYTDTRVQWLYNLSNDLFYLNGEKQSKEETNKISRFLDLFRDELGINGYAKVESYNHVPTAAGLASSASAFAALAGACRESLHLDWSNEKLSTFARRGSGSATRSVYGGFVEWNKGTSSVDSKAIAIDDANWDVGMVIIAINKAKKKVSSREGMQLTVATSPFYSQWVEQSEQDLIAIKEAIANQDIQRVGEIAETNAMRMHATTLAANPPFTYFEPETLQAIASVQALREKGFTAYYTIDAGPNVKVLCKASEMSQIKQHLSETFTNDQLITTTPGDALTRLDHWEYEDVTN